MINALKEQGWAICDDFITLSELTQLNQAFTAGQQQGLFQAAKIGQGTNHQQQTAIRGDQTWWFDPLSPPTELRTILGQLSELKQQLNQKLFLGLKDWEGHLASYAAGTFYKKHLDRHQAQSCRKLSLILYLNLAWQPAFGGELVLYDRKEQELQRILPLGGRLVVFLSEDFPHEVLPATRERRSLTGWFLDAPRGVV